MMYIFFFTRNILKIVESRYAVATDMDTTQSTFPIMDNTNELQTKIAANKAFQRNPSINTLLASIIDKSIQNRIY